jgi:hypothetical protein
MYADCRFFIGYLVYSWCIILQCVYFFEAIAQILATENLIPNLLDTS